MIHLSHLRAVTRIPDPVHGHIEFNVFETEVIDSPYFQRLHHILQNSTTYVAFPANKNTRFSHSLGTAYISGKLLRNSLSHASTTDLREFLEEIGTFMRCHFLPPARNKKQNQQTLDLLCKGWKKTVKGRSKFTHQPFLKQDVELIENEELFGCDDKGEFGFSAAFIVDTLWVSSRICGLVHDIGHLPMSHSFEGALAAAPLLFSLHQSGEDRKQRFTDVSSGTVFNKDQSTDADIIDRFLPFIEEFFGVSDELITKFINSIEIHERRSLAILNILANTENIEDSEFEEYRHIVYTISFFTLFASIVDKRGRIGKSAAQEFGAISNSFRLLKSIFAGEVDADRMDYTIRDGLSCGSTIGNFDLDRVLSNAVLIKHHEEDHYGIAFDERALSGLERFFSERYDGYKYLIYHRTSSRTEACLQELIARLIHYAFLNLQSQITTTLVEYGFVHREEGGDITDIVPMTKSTLENFDDSALRSAFFSIRRKIETLQGTEGDLISDDMKLLEPISCLIDVVLFREFDNIHNPFKERSFHLYMQEILGTGYKKDEFSGVVSALLNKVTGEIYTRKLKEAFQSEFHGKYTTIVQFQLPKIYDYQKANKYEKIYLINKKKNLSSLESLSFDIRNLRGKMRRDVDIKIYYLSKCVKICEDEIKEIETHLKEVLLNLYDGILRDEATTKLEK